MRDVEKLRAAREAMSELFLLTPAMWQEWIEDELPPYTGLQQRCQPVFPRQAYRQYEQAIFLSIDETDTQAKEKQVQRIRGLFRRQLSVPLADMSSSLTQYKTWEEKQGSVRDPIVLSAYQKAMEMYNARAHFEEHEKSGTPARVQVLYERDITDIPTSPDLWVDYTRHLDKTLKVGSVVSNVYLRATKNFSWVGELWVRYLLSMECSHTHTSEKELAEIFEKSL
ncbi:hypothetical protein PIB30_057815 [Stylosanthes scabra]|uniref:Uncharacterized protein n=1 Tax=Stylosanthes scabra TaxID=79078 RepID=A0ABU6ZIH8_9FABA|nr:hypothetical protein [Stylosanthes scabra]